MGFGEPEEVALAAKARPLRKYRQGQDLCLGERERAPGPKRRPPLGPSPERLRTAWVQISAISQQRSKALFTHLRIRPIVLRTSGVGGSQKFGGILWGVVTTNDASSWQVLPVRN